MTPRERVLHTLRGPVAARIRFVFPTSTGRVTIAPQTFQHVASAIERNRVHIHVMTTAEITAAGNQGIGAQYDPSTNTLIVPPIIGRVDEGLLLHECTHAAYDLLRTGITTLDDESSCYVVDALYFRMTGLRHPRWDGEPHRTAGAVAETLLHQYAVGVNGIPEVGADTWAILRLAVMMNPVYMFPWRATGDYTLGPAVTGGTYTHDG